MLIVGIGVSVFWDRGVVVPACGSPMYTVMDRNVLSGTRHCY